MVTNNTHHSPKAKTDQFRNITQDSPTDLPNEAIKRMFNITAISRMVELVDNLSMSRLRDIFLGAESGMLGRLIDIYIRIIASDARINGMVKTRRQAASSAKYVINSGNEGNNKADAAAELVKNNIDRLRWKDVVGSLLDGRFYGVALFEKIWIRSPDGNLYIADTEQIDHTRIKQWNLGAGFQGNIDRDDRFGELYIEADPLARDSFNTREFVKDLPPYKIIEATNTDREGLYDLAGIMRPVARWFVIKTFLIKSWAQYAETYGFPVPVVTVSQSEFEKNKNQIKTLLESVGANRYGIFFDTMEYEMHSASSPSDISVFEKFMDIANKEMAIAILGQNLTSDVDSGSRAASETHFKVMQSLIEDDTEWLDEIIQSQFVDELVRVNFPNLDLEDYPTYKSIINKNVNLEQLGRGLQSVSKLVEIPKRYIYEQAQIPTPSDGEDTVGGDADAQLRRSLEQN